MAIQDSHENAMLVFIRQYIKNNFEEQLQDYK